MTAPGRVLLLVGSPKGPKSTSESLGTYLLERLQEQGMETETARIYPALKSEERWAAMLAAIDQADLVILAFPLYVDALPAATTRALELIAAHRQAVGPANRPQFVAIANCGFPEAQHCDTALAICRVFVREAGFEWAGGLALGAGPAIDGKPLAEAGGMVRNVVQALNQAAEALARGQAISQEATELMAKPLMPSWMYMTMGGLGWRLQAHRHGVWRLGARPHQTRAPVRSTNPCGGLH